MLALKRTVTAILLFVPLFIFLYFAILVVGGGISGGIAGMENPDNPEAAGEQAGLEFAENYMGIISILSLVVSLLGSVALSFTGILPWCRSPQDKPATQPPPLQ